MKKHKNAAERFMHILFFTCALTSVAAVALICIFLFAGGAPAFFRIGAVPFLLGRDWSPSDVPPAFGILPMIVGSLYVTVGAVLIGVPIGILTAVFMARMCPDRLYKILKPATELLAGIPSVVYGFFGLVVVVPLIKDIFGGSGTSTLAASILLGIMILPTIIGVSEAAIRSVPGSYYEGALALGASHERAVFLTEVPAAKSGILAGVILGIGRAIGETMAVVMVAGNAAVIPKGFLDGARTLTSNIVIEMGYAADLHREALIATGVVLFAFILLINIGFSVLKRKVAG